MKILIFTNLILLCLLCQSCAYIFKGEYHSITVLSDSPTRITGEDILRRPPSESTSQKFLIKGKPDQIHFTASSEGTNMEFNVSRSVDAKYFFLNFLSFGLGNIVDFSTGRIYRYRTVYLDMDRGIYYHTSKRYIQNRDATKRDFSSFTLRAYRPRKGPGRSVEVDKYFNSGQKGKTYITVNIPMGSYFSMYSNKLQEWKYDGGALGIGLGAEYFYTDYRSVSAQATYHAALVFPTPIIGTAATYSLRVDHLTKTVFSLTHNNHINRVSFGYGMHSTFGRYVDNIGLIAAVASSEPGIVSNKWSVGPTANMFVKINRGVKLGLSYSPSLITLGKRMRTFSFEPTLSLDMKMNFGVGKKNKTTPGRKI